MRLGVLRNGASRLTKGIEEILQRNEVASGLMVDAWPGVNERPIFGNGREYRR